VARLRHLKNARTRKGSAVSIRPVLAVRRTKRFPKTPIPTAARLAAALRKPQGSSGRASGEIRAMRTRLRRAKKLSF
jgi:hypothetical protein